jgi:hypothetical protein
VQLIPLGRPLHHTARLAFTADGRFLGVEAHPFTLFDTLGGGDPVQVPSGGSFESHYRFVRSGAAVASRTDFNAVAVRDLRTGEVVRRTLDLRVEDLAPGPGGETLFVHGYALGLVHGEVHVLDAADLTSRREFLWRGGHMLAFTVSADGRWAAARDISNRYRNSRLHVGPTHGSGTPTRLEPPGYVSDFCLNPDGSRLAAATTKGLVVWDTASGREVVHSGKHRRAVNAVAWAPDRPLLATGDSGGLVFFWDAAGRVLRRYQWGLTKVDGLAFAPDGCRCAAAGGALGDARIVVWDVDV